MADNATSNFPKMGEFALTDSIVNVSGNRSPYTQVQARSGPSADENPGGTAVRGQMAMNGENPGPRFAPQTTISFPNAPEASQTGRGLRVVPSSIGNRDFWDSRYETGQAY